MGEEGLLMYSSRGGEREWKWKAVRPVGKIKLWVGEDGWKVSQVNDLVVSHIYESCTFPSLYGIIIYMIHPQLAAQRS